MLLREDVTSPAVYIGPANNYFHTITETLPALHRQLDRMGELGRLNARLYFTGGLPELIGFFSRHPLEPLPDPAPELLNVKDSGGLRRLVMVSDFLSARVPWDREPAGITVVQRLGKRQYEQHGELVDALARFGLPVRAVAFEQLSFEEQVNLARNTRLLVGPHGAGETNMIFMPPGAVVELNPMGFGITTFKRMADAFGHELRQLEATEHGIPFGGRRNPAHEYIDVHGWPTPELLAAAPADIARQLRRVVRDVRSFPLAVDRVLDAVDQLLP